MKSIHELNSILNSTQLKYDYFLYAKNSELRSTNALKLLKKAGVKIKNLIEIKFEDSNKTRYAKSGSLYSVLCPYRDESQGASSIFDCLRELNLKNSEKLCIDITGIDSPYLFHILKIIKTKKILSKIDIVYTSPKTYKKNSDGYIFSKGIKEVKQLPAFTGRTNPNAYKVLLVMLGFEGYRSTEVLSEIDPDKTIALNGFPSYSLEFKDTSVIENKELLNDPSCKNNVSLAAAHDPFETAEMISNLPPAYRNQNVIISPIGTKPMSLGACLYCLKDDSVRVVFPYPNSYLKKGMPAEKIGKTWLYRLDL